MIDLVKTDVHRCGVTASSYLYENSECMFEANSKDRSLDFNFSMDSKGGGKTAVLLQIGIEDLSAILTEVVHEMPVAMSILAKSIVAANTKIQRDRRRDTKTVKEVIRKLDKLEGHLYQQYLSAPVRDDEAEHERLSLIQEVGSALAELN